MTEPSLGFTPGGQGMRQSIVTAGDLIANVSSTLLIRLCEIVPVKIIQPPAEPTVDGQATKGE